MSQPWRSERLIYRAIETDDDPFLAALGADGEAFMNAAPFIPLPQGKDATTKFREFLNSQLLSAMVCLPPPVSDPVATTEGGPAKAIPIGIINLVAAEPRMVHHRRSEVGVNIARAYQGQGYGTEAIKWALRFGFRHCNLHRIEIEAFGWNAGAIRLYEKLGFKHESRKRDYLWHDGAYYDFVGLAILEDEWRELYDKE
jgi:RimJ/RimL family protein N-acetyltransferase